MRGRHDDERRGRRDALAALGKATERPDRDRPGRSWFLGEVVDGGHMPAATPGRFLLRPLGYTGGRNPGDAVTFAGRGGPVPVVVFGPSPPAAGTRLVADLAPWGWVSEFGGSPPPCRVCVTAADRCGAPLPGLNVSISRHMTTVASGVTGPDGTFCAAIAAPGNYVATVSGPGLVTQSKAVTACVPCPCPWPRSLDLAPNRGAGWILAPGVSVADPPLTYPLAYGPRPAGVPGPAGSAWWSGPIAVSISGLSPGPAAAPAAGAPGVPVLGDGPATAYFAAAVRDCAGIGQTFVNGVAVGPAYAFSPVLCEPACACFTMPERIIMSVANPPPNNGLPDYLFPCTLTYQPTPADVAGQVNYAAGYWSEVFASDPPDGYPFRYTFSCAQGIYYLSRFPVNNPPVPYNNQITTFVAGLPGNTCNPFSFANHHSLNTVYESRGVTLAGDGGTRTAGYEFVAGLTSLLAGFHGWDDVPPGVGGNVGVY